MMNDSTNAACAMDVVRCLYLARVAERLGHRKAARRWLKKADRWLETIDQFSYAEGVAFHSPGSAKRHPGVRERV